MSLPVMSNFSCHNDNNIDNGIRLPFSKRLLIFSYRERPEKIFRCPLLSNCIGNLSKGQAGSPIGERPFVQDDTLKLFARQVFTFK